MKKSLSILALSLLSAHALAAGSHAGGHDTPADPARVGRTIDVIMDDTMRFTPSEIHVRAGETIRFSVTNAGKIRHEMVIGSIAELKAHAVQMRKMPEMPHAEPNMITLEPGGAGALVWKFDQAGIVDFACLIPGHTEAGMIGKVKVN
ncbi:MAG TPA: cupredoxin family protein [Candidimonas sp.]|nr:cupredoxin family protein [Candidimonas sp.]